MISVMVGETSFEVAVPPGILDGDVFSVAIPTTADEPPPAELDDVLAALNVVLDALEDHDDDVLDGIVDQNCSKFAEWVPENESTLEEYSLFQGYVAECEGFIAEVLTSINSSAEAVFDQAQRYEGDDERVQRLVQRLLATDDFPTFCKMMRDRHEILQIFNS